MKPMSRRTILSGPGDGDRPALARGDDALLEPWPPGRPSASPRRMAFFYVPNGVHMPDWTPKTGEPARRFDLPDILKPLAALQG